ncbi:hypothetical protein LguiB_006607 [Lonicera macranthoides]
MDFLLRLGPPAGKSSSSSSSLNYDVFLSFRGEEHTAKCFTNHLDIALLRAGLNTFFRSEDVDDDTEIERAIENSRVSIIVFSSEDFAPSVEELVKILECRRNFGNLVLPVYYGVDSSQVEASIRKALEKYEEELKVEIMDEELRKAKVIMWRKALKETECWSELVPRILLKPADDDR